MMPQPLLKNAHSGLPALASCFQLHVIQTGSAPPPPHTHKRARAHTIIYRTFFRKTMHAFTKVPMARLLTRSSEMF